MEKEKEAIGFNGLVCQGKESFSWFLSSWFSHEGEGGKVFTATSPVGFEFWTVSEGNWKSLMSLKLGVILVSTPTIVTNGSWKMFSYQTSRWKVMKVFFIKRSKDLKTKSFFWRAQSKRHPGDEKTFSAFFSLKTFTSKKLSIELSTKGVEGGGRDSRQNREMKKGKPLKFNFQTIKRGRAPTDWKLAGTITLTRLQAAEDKKGDKLRNIFRQLNKFQSFICGFRLKSHLEVFLILSLSFIDRKTFIPGLSHRAANER